MLLLYFTYICDTELNWFITWHTQDGWSMSNKQFRPDCRYETENSKTVAALIYPQCFFSLKSMH